MLRDLASVSLCYCQFSFMLFVAQDLQLFIQGSPPLSCTSPFTEYYGSHFFFSLISVTWYLKLVDFHGFRNYIHSNIPPFPITHECFHPFVPHLFTTPVSLKLTKNNFLIWKHQILATIQGLEFLHFLEGDNIPSQFSIDTDTATQTLNPTFYITNVKTIFLQHGYQLLCLPQCSTKWWASPQLSKFGRN